MPLSYRDAADPKRMAIGSTAVALDDRGQHGRDNESASPDNTDSINPFLPPQGDGGNWSTASSPQSCYHTASTSPVIFLKRGLSDMVGSLVDDLRSSALYPTAAKGRLHRQPNERSSTDSGQPHFGLTIIEPPSDPADGNPNYFFSSLQHVFEADTDTESDVDFYDAISSAGQSPSAFLRRPPVQRLADIHLSPNIQGLNLLAESTSTNGLGLSTNAELSIAVDDVVDFREGLVADGLGGVISRSQSLRDCITMEDKAQFSSGLIFDGGLGGAVSKDNLDGHTKVLRPLLLSTAVPNQDYAAISQPELSSYPELDHSFENNFPPPPTIPSEVICTPSADPDIDALNRQQPLVSPSDPQETMAETWRVNFDSEIIVYEPPTPSSRPRSSSAPMTPALFASEEDYTHYLVTHSAALANRVANFHAKPIPSIQLQVIPPSRDQSLRFQTIPTEPTYEDERYLTPHYQPSHPFKDHSKQHLPSEEYKTDDAKTFSEAHDGLPLAPPMSWPSNENKAESTHSCVKEPSKPLLIERRYPSMNEYLRPVDQTPVGSQTRPKLVPSDFTPPSLQIRWNSIPNLQAETKNSFRRPFRANLFSNHSTIWTPEPFELSRAETQFGCALYFFHPSDVPIADAAPKFKQEPGNSDVIGTGRRVQHANSPSVRPNALFGWSEMPNVTLRFSDQAEMTISMIRENELIQYIIQRERELGQDLGVRAMAASSRAFVEEKPPVALRPHPSTVARLHAINTVRNVGPHKFMAPQAMRSPTRLLFTPPPAGYPGKNPSSLGPSTNNPCPILFPKNPISSWQMRSTTPQSTAPHSYYNVPYKSSYSTNENFTAPTPIHHHTRQRANSPLTNRPYYYSSHSPQLEQRFTTHH